MTNVSAVTLSPRLSSGTNAFGALIRYQAAFQKADLALVCCSTARPLFVDCRHPAGRDCGLARAGTPELTEVRPALAGP